jgi:hypothetical protein
MTLRYAHLALSHKVKAVDILDNALSGRTEKNENCFNFTTYGVSGEKLMTKGQLHLRYLLFLWLVP